MGFMGFMGFTGVAHPHPGAVTFCRTRRGGDVSRMKRDIGVRILAKLAIGAGTALLTSLLFQPG